MLRRRIELKGLAIQSQTNQERGKFDQLPSSRYKRLVTERAKGKKTVKSRTEASIPTKINDVSQMD